MKKLKFNIRKGFTLVECIIAIAVFAIMTSMVLMIMASTVKMSKKASESEEGLNQLVQNVVQDSSNKVYGNDSKTLQMSFGGSTDPNFSITYSTVDGARNMIRCPDCGYEANSEEFLSYLYTHTDYTTQSDDVKKRYKISHWFNPSVSGKNYYECPECGHTTLASSINMKCYSCETTGAATSFLYDDINGGYFCPDCGGGKVVQLDSTSGLPINSDMEKVNYDFKISSIQSNAIRYADIEAPDDEARKDFMSLTSASANGFNFNLAYTASTAAQAAGVYTMTISGFTPMSGHTSIGDDGAASSVTIKLPPAYQCMLLPSSTGVNVPDGTVDTSRPTASWDDPDDYANNADTSELRINNITENQTITLKFTLTNYKNNHSFDDDYKDEGGLTGFWYGGSSINYTVPEPEPGP